MSQNTNPHNPIDQKYIELLEKSNVTLHKSRHLFHLRNLFIYIGIIAIIFSLTFFLRDFFRTNDVFKGHLNDVAFNQNKILVKTDDGVYYEINDSSNYKWLSENGVLINVNASELSFSTTEINQKNWDKYYSLIIPKNKKYSLKLIDGTEILINENSTVRFTNNKTERKTNIFLSGEAYFKVAHQKINPFLVEAFNVNIQVLGTEFNVNNYKQNKKTKVTLVEGSVLISNPSGHKKLKPGQEATVYNNKKGITIEENDFNESLFWTSDQFYFSDQSLDYIAHKLEQWYDVKFVFLKEPLKKLHFTGRIRKEDGLLHVLKLLEYSEGINYHINDTVISLSKK